MARNHNHHHSRSTVAKAVRNAKRRMRRETTLTNREILSDLVPHTGSEEDYRKHQLQYYATLARNTQVSNEEDVVENLTDGSSSPDLCSWFETFSNDDLDLPMLAPLRSLLTASLNRLQHEGPIWDEFINWAELPRDSQGPQDDFIKKFGIALQAAAKELRVGWSHLLGCSSAQALCSPLCADLLRSLYVATTRPNEREDLPICDEISKGCNIGIREPVKASGLWPADKGPKYTGYELALWAADSWKNYKSCEEAVEQVRDSLDKEVSMGHMTILSKPAPDSVCTKIACVVKPSGKLRLIDDLRRSGVNERVHCEETICLPGLRSAAYLVQQLSKTATVDDPLVWIEADIASAFRHLPVNKFDRKFLVNHVGHLFYQHVRLPFGLRSSPLLWCRLFGSVHRLVKKLVCGSAAEGAGMVYVDDLGWIVPKSRACEVTAKILLIYSAVGLNIAYDKLRISSTPHNLGFEWDLGSKSVRVPEEKRLALLTQLRSFISAPDRRVMVSQLEKLTGRLTWLMQITPRLKAAMAPFYALQAAARKHALRHVTLGSSICQSCRLFLNVLASPRLTGTTASQLLGWAATIEDRCSVVVTDASLQGIGGVVFDLDAPSTDVSVENVEWFCKEYSQSTELSQFTTRSPPTSADICSLELIAAGVATTRALTRKPDLVIVLSDNTPTVHALRRNSASAQSMKSILRSFNALWPVGGFVVTAYHIRGDNNSLADFLSRSDRSTILHTVQHLGAEFDAAPILRTFQRALMY